MTRPVLLALLPHVIAALSRLRMRDHVRCAIELERATREQRAPTPDRHGIVWGEAMVVTWAKRLHVPPFEDALPVRPYEYRCTCSRLADRHTRGTWPGASLSVCTACDDERIVEDG